MDAISLLKDDHKNVKHLFEQFEKQSGVRQGEIGTRILNELEAHTQVEEEIFYPAVRELPDERSRELVNEAYEEHRQAKDLIRELRGREPGQETYDAQFKVLRDNIEHHVEEEENEMFPHVRPLMREQLVELGSRMQARKRELRTGSATIGGTLRGLMTRAYEAVSGSESETRRKPKRSARSAKAKTATRVRRKATAAKPKRAASKTKKAGRKRTATRTAAQVKGRATRKQAAAKTSARAKGPRRGQARRASRRAAATKR